jgi:hypothetical protein
MRCQCTNVILPVAGATTSPRLLTSTIVRCARPRENKCDGVAVPVSECPTSQASQARTGRGTV